LEKHRRRAQRRRKHTELRQELQLTIDGSPAAPSIDSPLASSGDWLRKLAAGCNNEEVSHSTLQEEAPHWTLKKELNLDMAGTMMTKQPSLTSIDWETNGYWTQLPEPWS
jgi:hypothetical protein